MNDSIKIIEQNLKDDKQLYRIAKVESRPMQISIEPINNKYSKVTKEILKEIIAKCDFNNKVKILESSHSFDVIPHFISKNKLVDRMKTLAKEKRISEDILCIGDKGKWPGNDYDLLSTLYSLSVDTTSMDPKSCWNLSLPGYKGIQSTIYYLDSISILKTSEFKILLKNGGQR